VVAPYLGAHLVLRRMPLVALAIPQTAGCGQALAFLLAARTLTGSSWVEDRVPTTELQLLCAFGLIVVVLLVLSLANRRSNFAGVHAGLVYLAAIALREIFFLESGGVEEVHDLLHHGRILTVGVEGRNIIAITCAVVLIAVWGARRRLWLAAFDTDEMRLQGRSPRIWMLYTYLLIAALCTFCVQELGPEVILSLMLIPPAIVRPFCPRLAYFVPLSVIAAISGSLVAFFLSVQKDWPASPAMVASLLMTSALISLICLVWQRSRQASAAMGR